MTLRDASAFVLEHHRHHPPPPGGLWAVGAAREGRVVGCAIVGRPVARGLQDGKTAEVTRLCTDGTRNACSMLYGACWRAARALGYTRLVTYILAAEVEFGFAAIPYMVGEPGTSLKAAGWTRVLETRGGSWSRPSRRRDDRHPLGRKVRWERTVG